MKSILFLLTLLIIGCSTTSLTGLWDANTKTDELQFILELKPNGTCEINLYLKEHWHKNKDCTFVYKNNEIITKSSKGKVRVFKYDPLNESLTLIMEGSKVTNIVFIKQ